MPVQLVMFNQTAKWQKKLLCNLRVHCQKQAEKETVVQPVRA